MTTTPFRPSDLGRTTKRALALGVALLLCLPGVPIAQASTSGPTVSGWLVYWDQERGRASFADNTDLYGELSPFWYEMRSATSIASYPKAGDQAVLEAARSRGVPVIPTISNDYDPVRVGSMLASATNRTAHVKALVDLVTVNGFDGIDIDYENMHETDRDNFTAFMRELGSALRSKGKLLSVALHSKTAEPGVWNGPRSHDYAALGSVVDRARVMAYGYSWATSSAGPIAPLPWVDDVARFASSVIPSSKLQLGMPTYGYDWVGNRGVSLTYDQVEARRVKYGAVRRWDDVAKVPWFTYEADGVAHTVYYEDAESIAAKIAVVTKYDLSGAVLWRLGGEDPAIWPAFRSAWGGSGSSSPPPSSPPAWTGSPSVPGLFGTSRIIDLIWGTPSSGTGGDGSSGALGGGSLSSLLGSGGFLSSLLRQGR